MCCGRGHQSALQLGLPEPRGVPGTSRAASAAGRGAVGFHMSPGGRLKLLNRWRWRWVECAGYLSLSLSIYIYIYVLKEISEYWKLIIT